MSKATLTREIHKELDKLNDRIDRKILKGAPFEKEAVRHKELLATLRQMDEDLRQTVAVRRSVRRAKSPVRRSLKRGVVARIFTFGMA